MVANTELPIELRLWPCEIAADCLGVHPNTVLRLAREGDDPIPSIEIGPGTFVSSPRSFERGRCGAIATPRPSPTAMNDADRIEQLTARVRELEADLKRVTKELDECRNSRRRKPKRRKRKSRSVTSLVDPDRIDPTFSGER